MSSGNKSDGQPQGAGLRGLWRLMLKLPALRGRLQLLAAKSESLVTLCEAYEDACVTLQRLHSLSADPNPTMMQEYETICSEIETEIIQYCLEHRANVPE